MFMSTSKKAEEEKRRWKVVSLRYFWRLSMKDFENSWKILLKVCAFASFFYI